MARTPSNMIPLGTDAPKFSLPDTVDGEEKSLNKLKGKNGTLIAFICNHCPFVIHINPQLVAIANEYQCKGIGFITISSNDIANYPQDAPHLMKKTAEKLGYPFPYLYDENQAVAKAYDAACTPDFYLFDSDLKLVYRGQMDNSRPGNGVPVSGNDLRAAMNALLSGNQINIDQKPSMGCNIKWK